MKIKLNHGRKKQMVNGWKVTAIIFIILFIIETLLFGWIINLGIEVKELETKCAYNICADYGSYYFDINNYVCSCYENNEIVYEGYIG